MLLLFYDHLWDGKELYASSSADSMNKNYLIFNISKSSQSVQSLGLVWFFATPWVVSHQASLSIINFWSLLKLMSSEVVMPSYHLILCCPLLLLPSLFPNIRVFSKWVSSLHHVSKVLEFQLQHQSFQCAPRTDLL